MKNGIHFIPVANEYQIWLDGEFITWASTQTIGQQIYIEALQTKCAYLKHTEQTIWEWHTLTTPNLQIIKALDLATVK